MLRPSQVEAAAAVSEISKLLLADMGTGKTATAITAIRIRKGRTLLISTVRICNCTWPEEVRTWAPELIYQSAAGATAAKRIKAIEGYADIVGINFESVKTLVEKYGKKLPEMFPNLIIDESSRLENPNTQAFKALKPLLPHFQWRLAMTGTPRANYLADFWSHAYVADLGEALGPFRESFRQKFFTPRQTPFKVQYRPLPTAEEDILSLLKPITHRLIFDGTKPEVVVQDIFLPLNKEVEKIQEHGHKEFQIIHEGRRIVTKMVQLASGIVYKKAYEEVEIHQDKYDVLKDIVAECHGEPLLVVTNFLHEIKSIRHLFPQARLLETEKDVTAWNNREIEILIVHPLSCGHGLNIQFGGSVMIWFSPPPTEDAELYAQTIARLARPGQKDKAVKVLRLIMEGTMDKDIYNNMEAKLVSQKKSLGAWE